jgi:acyl-coenzyme A thioesterase PaaI-like protein
VVCGAEAARDLRVEFEALPDGSVQGVLAGRPDLEGYPHTLHGGVIASLLDGAMTNCLFAHGVVAVTGKLTVRYRHPVSTDRPVRVRAWIEDASDDLFLMASELQQAERVAARGKAKFARRP